MSGRTIATWAAAGAALTVLAAAVGFSWLFERPGVVFLTSAEGAEWILLDRPRRPVAYKMQPHGVTFRTEFEIEDSPAQAVLRFRAIDAATIRLDRKVVYAETAEAGDPRRIRSVDLAPGLVPGSHELEIRVVATSTPALLWAHSEALSLRTGADWTATGNQRDWPPALLARDGPKPFPVSREFPHAGKALVACLPLLAPVFLAVAYTSRRAAASGSVGRPAVIDASRVRFALLGAWVVLALNNLDKVPVSVGMDLNLHMDYIRYLVVEHRIPLATQGGEMMQAPLAYLIFAPLYAWLAPILSEAHLLKLLRIVPFACGIAQVEICYRAVRMLYPRREDLQIAGTVLGGLLPVNLTLAHAVANEPVAGITGAVTVLLALRILTSSAPPSRRILVGTGIAFGLALLSKVTAVLLGPPLFVAVALRAAAAERSLRRVGPAVAWVFGTAALLAGWYYVRNLVLMGSPFIGTWNADVGASWWQEPGYRTWSQYLRFGEALAYPVFAAGVGLWDGLYSTLWLDGQMSGIAVKEMAPPWNQSFLLAGAWWALLPTTALVLGAVRAIRSPEASDSSDGTGGTEPVRVRAGQRFALACVACYLAALVYLNLRVPFYCVAKASYLVATTPCLAVLAAAGFDRLTRNPRFRPVVYGASACWAVCVYSAYFVL